jgi:branched-chain amino acid transport system substrate-binding protein
VVTAGIYSATHPSALNRQYVDAYQKMTGHRANFISVGGYDGMHLIYAALQKTGGKTDADAVIAAMKGMSWESPHGPISIDPRTRDIAQNVYIRKVETVSGPSSSKPFPTSKTRSRKPRRIDPPRAADVVRFRRACCFNVTPERRR